MIPATACTLVVTQVAWHKHLMFLAKIELMMEKEWVDKIMPLLEDMRDLGSAAIPK